MYNFAKKAVACVLTQRARLLLVLGLLLAACWPALANQYYDYTVIAQTGDPAGATGYTLMGFKPNPTINDDGQVAFIGILQSSPGLKAGEQLFRYNNGTTYSYSDVADISVNKEFGSVWLNNNHQLAATLLVSGNPTVDTVRRYPGANSAYDIIAKGGAARDRFGNAQFPFDNIFDNLSMNNGGTIAFSGQLPFTTFTALTNTGAGGKLTFGGFLDLRPAIDDSGRIVVRSGGQPNSPILLWNQGFTSPEPIATGASGFTRMGQSPGITDNGGVAAFYAEDASGPGIFVSTNTGSGRVWQAVARTNTDLTSFSQDSRVGIAAMPCGANALTVTYLATSGGKLCLLANDLNGSGNLAAPFILEPRKLVVSQGDTLTDQDGISYGVVQTLSVYDPVNSQGQIVFWVRMADLSEAIVLAKPHVKGFHQIPTDRNATPLRFDQGVSSCFGIPTNANDPDPCGVGTDSTWGYGCMLCSVTTMLNYNGVSITPTELNRRLVGLRDHVGKPLGYAPKNLLKWPQLNRIAKIFGGRLMPDISLDAATFNQDLESLVCANHYSVILKLQHKKANGQLEYKNGSPRCHYVFLVGQSSDDWIIFDPALRSDGPGGVSEALATSLTEHLSGFTLPSGSFYGFVLLRAIPFKFVTGGGLVAPTPQFSASCYSPVELLVQDPLGRTLGNAGSGSVDVFTIPQGIYIRDLAVGDDSGDGPSIGDSYGDKTAVVQSPIPGNYTVVTTGTAPGNYSLDFVLEGLGGASKVTTFSGITDVGVVSNYSVVFPVIGSADLAVSQFASTNAVNEGSNLTFTVSITNGGPNTATAVSLIDPLPTWSTFVSASTGQGTVTQAYGTVTASLNDLPAGSNATVTIVIAPTAARPLTNTVSLLLFESDPNLTNNTATTVVSVLGTNLPPVAVNNSAITTNGAAALIDVLANDIGFDGTIVPSTVAITRTPTNGTPSVDPNTGVITYTPNASPAGTNTDSLRYTVQDDLGSTSNEGIVTVTNVFFNGVAANSLSPLPDFLVLPATSGAVDHRYPRINNPGEIVYNQQVSGLWQVWKKPAGNPSATSANQMTFPTASYNQALSPAIADDGSYICYRNTTNSSLPRDILIYPNPAVALTNPSPTLIYSSHEVHNSLRDEVWECQTTPSITSDGKQVWGYDHWFATISGNGGQDSSLILGNQGVLSTADVTVWNYPDANAGGQFVYTRNNQIFLNNQILTNGTQASINDIPRDNPDVVYVNGTNFFFTLFGRLQSFTPGEIGGTWVDINRDGILTFEKLVNGRYQVFKAYPWEPTIVSTGGTNALVGMPYRYSSDNIAQAYGGVEGAGDDPRGAIPITWSLVSGPPGFTIDPATGHINWIPTAPGTYTYVISAANWNLALGDVADYQTNTVIVAQSTFQVVDAVDFRTPGTPDLPTTPTNYFTGGTPRIGAQADGASRLLFRVRLVGAETNSFPNLHFVVAGTNWVHDGLLRSVSGTTWTTDVPATIATMAGTNAAVCLYESPMDFDVASQPVTVQLLNGTNVIAAQSILLRRPPVVLVHDGWSGPGVWPVLTSQLLDAGMDVYVVDYSFTSGSSLNANAYQIFLQVNQALLQIRQSGFAASRMDLVGHGAGGILARLHAQRYAPQDTNYRKGDVHKLITLGAPHQGSWLAALLVNLRTNNAAAYNSLRSAVLSASTAAGQYPPDDLNSGWLDDLAPGSAILSGLEVTTVPSHAIQTTISTMPPSDMFAFIQYYLGLTNQADGFVTTNSAVGGIDPNALTGFNGTSHAFQPFDTNVTARVLSLLTQPLSGSNNFAFFPPAVASTNSAPTPIVPVIGTWLSLSGATNGQTFNPGQTVNLTATASGGHILQSVEYVTLGKR